MEGISIMHIYLQNDKNIAALAAFVINQLIFKILRAAMFVQNHADTMPSLYRPFGGRDNSLTRSPKEFTLVLGLSKSCCKCLFSKTLVSLYYRSPILK